MKKKWERGWKKIFHLASILPNETPAWDSYPVTQPLVTEGPWGLLPLVASLG